MFEGSLPQSWRSVRLRELVSETETINPRTQPDRLFSYVDVSGVSNETFCITEVKELLGQDAPSRARKLIRANDVIFATVRPTLRRVAVVPSGLDGQVCSTGFCVLRANKNKLEPEYLYEYLLTEDVAGRVEALQRGATYPAIADSDLLNQLLPLPPLPEQRAIARILRAVQEAVQARRREIALESEHKAALMEYLFSYGTRGEATKQTEIGEVPRSWEVVEFRDVAQGFFSGGTPSTVDLALWDGSVAWTTSAPISEDAVQLDRCERYITERGLRNSATHLVPKSNLLVGTRVGVGKAVVNLIDIAISQDLTGVVLDKARLDPLFGAYQFKTQRVQRHFTSRRRGTTIKGVSRFDLQSLRIFMPSLAEQRTIVCTLCACDTKIAALEREATLLEELFRAVLEELMSGRLSAVPLVEEADHY